MLRILEKLSGIWTKEDGENLHGTVYSKQKGGFSRSCQRVHMTSEVLVVMLKCDIIHDSTTFVLPVYCWMSDH